MLRGQGYHSTSLRHASSAGHWLSTSLTHADKQQPGQRLQNNLKI